MKRVTGPNVKPVIKRGYIPDDYERALDPWHRDAFAGIANIGGTSERKEGWMALDWAGNPIAFIPDGTEFDDDAYLTFTVDVAEERN